LQLCGTARALKMDEGSEKGLAGTGFTHNHERGKAVSKGRDPLLELDNGGAAAYDLDGIQSSGPGVKDQDEVRNVGRKENDGSQLEVSWTRKVSGTLGAI
jgi:hypothetical protein